MYKRLGIFVFLTLCIQLNSYTQQYLPNLNVKSYNGKVVVSWLNNQKKTISNILIQRSYDSSRNFSTIGTVLNPQAMENGYPDPTPPYDRMFYRVSITFEGGTYLIGPSFRPVREKLNLPELDVTYYPAEALQPVIITEVPVPEIKIDSVQKIVPVVKLDSPQVKPVVVYKKIDSATVTKVKPMPWELNHSFDSSKVIIPKKIIETNYPSNRVFINKNQFITINLPDATKKKYSIQFFDDKEKMIFELKRLTEEVYYLDKANFFHDGWFFLDIYENGELIEKNRIFIAKDRPKSIP